MTWDFFVVVGGSLLLAFAVYFAGLRQEYKERRAQEDES